MPFFFLPLLELDEGAGAAVFLLPMLLLLLLLATVVRPDDNEEEEEEGVAFSIIKGEVEPPLVTGATPAGLLLPVTCRACKACVT